MTYTQITIDFDRLLARFAKIKSMCSYLRIAFRQHTILSYCNVSSLIKQVL